jgi:hypothetical protein
MLRLPKLVAVLTLVVLVSAGYRTVSAQEYEDRDPDDASSVEANNVDGTEAGVDSVKTSENDDHAVPELPVAEEISGKLKSRADEVELLEIAQTPITRKDTEVEDVPDTPETKLHDNKTRSGNLDAYYGKSNWCQITVKICVFQLPPEVGFTCEQHDTSTCTRHTG